MKGLFGRVLALLALLALGIDLDPYLPTLGTVLAISPPYSSPHPPQKKRMKGETGRKREKKRGGEEVAIVELNSGNGGTGGYTYT